MKETDRSDPMCVFDFSSYNRWLCQARAEDLSDVASLKALYQTGEFKIPKAVSHRLTSRKRNGYFHLCVKEGSWDEA